MFTPKPLTVEHVYKIFHQIATESGHDVRFISIFNLIHSKKIKKFN